MHIKKYLLKKISNGYIFKNILAGGYSIEEEKPRIIDEQIMAGGNINRNYGTGTDTKITVKFSQLNGDTLSDYLNELGNEVQLSYYSPKYKEYKEGTFFVSYGKVTALYIKEKERFEEIEIELIKAGN